MGNEKIQAEIAKLTPTALITLFVLDATSLGGGFFRFYSGTDSDLTSVFYQGLEYVPYPIEVKGFEINAAGSPPRPSLILSNHLNAISSMVINYNDLIGAKITRKRTFEKFLDGRAGADSLAELPPDVFYIERKVAENKFQVEFELASSLDLDDVYLPKRIVYSVNCAWKYRGPECSFSGDYPVADILDAKFALETMVDLGEYNSATNYNINDYVFINLGPFLRYFLCIASNTGQYPVSSSLYWKADQCSQTVLGCKCRFGKKSLPFGGYPGTSKHPF